eukprot:SAG31_NODE_5821_length_2309_cov_7.914480_1_plen_399_part_01
MNDGGNVAGIAPAAAWAWLSSLSTADLVCRVPTMSHLPRKCSDMFGRCMQHISALLASDSAAAAERLLLAMPQLVLLPLGCTGQQAARRFRRRCRMFLAGEWSTLWAERPPARARRTPANSSTALTAAHVAAIRAVQSGRPGHACRLLTSHGLCTDDDEAFDFLRSVHFPAPDVDPAALSPEEQAAYDVARAAPLDNATMVLLRGQFEKIVPTLPSGVGPGPSGLRYEHLRAAHASPDGAAALQDILSRVASGTLNLSDSRLSALRKGPLPADGLRPIAAGEVLRRVAGRALIAVQKNSLESALLADNQFAFTSDGCLIVLRQIEAHLETHPADVLLSTDKRTAFQRKSRSSMIRWLLEHAPSILPLFHACYGEAATLHFEGRTLSSSHGCQQGCPLGT